MPLKISSEAPTLLVRRDAFERSELTRASVDQRFNLTPDEFRVEEDLIAIGPLFGDDAIGDLVEMLEGAGLVHYDDFFDLSGNWPDWLALFAMTRSR
ncbi:MAG TPA: hypothetical protein VJ672_04820 [Gemmatimonadaceae bacterium]|nr:hypothetical protein [Gemmatimonadaceae bacterium]